MENEEIETTEEVASPETTASESNPVISSETTGTSTEPVTEDEAPSQEASESEAVD